MWCTKSINAWFFFRHSAQMKFIFPSSSLRNYWMSGLIFTKFATSPKSLKSYTQRKNRCEDKTPKIYDTVEKITHLMVILKFWLNISVAKISWFMVFFPKYTLRKKRTLCPQNQTFFWGKYSRIIKCAPLQTILCVNKKAKLLKNKKAKLLKTTLE